MEVSKDIRDNVVVSTRPLPVSVNGRPVDEVDEVDELAYSGLTEIAQPPSDATDSELIQWYRERGRAPRLSAEDIREQKRREIARLIVQYEHTIEDLRCELGSL